MESGIQNPYAGIRNLEAGIRNPGPSWILLHRAILKSTENTLADATTESSLVLLIKPML